MEAFEECRPLLFGIAYRMLGSAMEAEDVIQEAYLRYVKVEDQIQTPKAYLTRVVTNLCLDQLKSARVQRELYVGPWLPEPVRTADAAVENELDGNLLDTQTLTMAFLVLLEKLTPAERAVFLLHEVFDYSYPEIAGILGKDAAACRQLLHRAKQHVVGERPRFHSTPEEQQMFMGKFISATTEGNVEDLVNLLAEDVISWSDGGGKVTAAKRPVVGRDQVLKIIMGFRKFYQPDMEFELAQINACPAWIVRQQGKVTSVFVFELDKGILQNMRVVVNPDKLRYLEQK